MSEDRIPTGGPLDIVEEVNVNGKDYRVIWHGADFIPLRGMTVQVSGICFTASGDIVLVAGPEDKNWSLPGGHLECRESLEEAFAREVREEACAEVMECTYIGCQEVHEMTRNGSVHFSARFWGKVLLLPFEPKFEITRRVCVRPEEFIDSLNWATVLCAQAIFDAGLEEERKRKTRCS